jgi:uncharacterized delta-60 repeat protein
MKRNSHIFFVSIITFFVFCFLLKTFITPVYAGKNESVPIAGINELKTETSFSAISKDVLEPAAGELDSSFNAALDSVRGYARAVAVQADGKIIVGGYFRTLNGIRSDNLVRLNSDRSIDSTFAASVYGEIYAIIVQTDGKILIGGDFTGVNEASRNRIARLNQDGSLDTTFNPGAGADNTVNDIAVQPDGKILLGGSFYGVNSVSRIGVARLNQDGSADSSFTSPFPPPIPVSGMVSAAVTVYSVALQPDGKIVVGTSIFLMHSNSGSSPVNSKPLFRLNANGTFDSSFVNNVNSHVFKVVIQPDGKILAAGQFSSVGGVRRGSIARLNSNGTLDSSFDPGTGTSTPTGGSTQIWSIYLKSDGKILIGGGFFTYNAVPRNRIAQLNADGSLDNAFAPSSNLDGSITSVISLTDGKIFAAGVFQILSGESRDSIAVFNADGSLDETANYSTTRRCVVQAIAAQPGGKIIIGGDSGCVGNIYQKRLARLNADGSVDQSFGYTAASAGGQVNSIVLQPDGKILVGGLYVGSDNSPIVSITRLNSDGTTDTSFSQGNLPSNRGIKQIALQTDGKIVIIYSIAAGNRLPSGGIARLNADGSLDSTFTNIFSFPFETVAVQSDGKILVGGPFSFGSVDSRTGSILHNGIFRLNSDGSHDADFHPEFIAATGRFTSIYSLAPQPDGKILVGGSIFTAGRTSPVGIVRIDSAGTIDSTFQLNSISSTIGLARVEDILPLSSGKILIGGLFGNIGTATQNNVARLNADGSMDNLFTSGTDGTVFDIALQTDGKVLVSGDFEHVNGGAQTSLARFLIEPTVKSRKRVRFF